MLTDHLTPGDDTSTENAVYFYGDGEPQTPRRLLERLARNGFYIILYLRIVPVIPYNALNLLAALARPGNRNEVLARPPPGDDLVGDAVVVEPEVAVGRPIGRVDDRVLDDPIRHRCRPPCHLACAY